MKPQQRKFIVEVKSARRRSQVRPNSIWGDTDLKALVREAETEAPHLFEAVGRPGDLAVKPSAETRTQGGRTTGSPQIVGPVAGPEGTGGLPGPSEEASASLVDMIPATVTTPQVSKRPRPTRGVRRAQSETIDAATEVAVNDLAALEEENRRLKGLLAQRLQQENVQLREMLERFMRAE